MKKIYFYAMLLISGIASSQETSHEITLVKDIAPAVTDSIGTPIRAVSARPRYSYAYNNKIYFAADDGSSNDNELWVSDGTSDGTMMLKDINPSSSSSPNLFFELNNTLYFKAQDGLGSTGYSLYTTDGTEVGTVSLGNDFNFAEPAIINNKAYIRPYTTDANGNTPIQVFDGTNFELIADTGLGRINVGAINVSLDGNSILMNMQYQELGSSVGIQLYSYDITNQNFTLVKNFASADATGDALNAYLNDMTKIGDVAYFTMYSEDGKSKLWITDGTTDGTVEVAAAASINSVQNFYAWEDKLFFEGDDGSNDQLWVYDPKTDTIKNISGVSADNPSGLSANHDPADFAAPGDGYLYYAGKSKTSTKRSLFRTDGNSTEAILANEINNIEDLVVLNHKLYFSANYASDVNFIGRELFTYTNDELNTLDTSTFELENSLSIYPNPSTNFLNVQSTLEGEINYTIYNILGKQVLKGTIENNVIDHNLTSGLYLLKLDNGSNAITKKIIVKD